MYQGIDAILGEIMAKADEETVIVFSSDHGIVPLDREVRLNNLFAEKGLLKYTLNRETGEYQIDWAKTRAIFLQMDNIYINPAGLGGNYHRASGPEYEKLRDQVIELLTNLKDANGTAPLAKVVKWEAAEKELQLPADRVGDLVVANRPTYGWVEEVTADGQVFADSLKGGYKQAILPESTDAMLTPFVIVGPGVQKNQRLEQPIRHIDQYPTIMTLLGKKIPDFVEGKVLAEVLGR
jgi:predicted AlkP superfamily phosphohydrolase/phosphomutase